MSLNLNPTNKKNTVKYVKLICFVNGSGRADSIKSFIHKFYNYTMPNYYAIQCQYVMFLPV